MRGRKHRDRELALGRGELRRDRHADADRGRLAADDVRRGAAAPPRARRRRARRAGLAEARRLVLVGHREGVDGAAAARDEVLDRRPRGTRRRARAAGAARRRTRGSAGARARRARRPPSRRASPSRRAGAGCRIAARHQALPSTRVAPLWATPSVPPVPWASASRAPATWRGPALAAQLPHRLDHEEDAAHARMVRREPAAVRVHRQLAAEPDAPVLDEAAALARLAEAEVLERREHGDREGVVDRAEVDRRRGARRPSRRPARPTAAPRSSAGPARRSPGGRRPRRSRARAPAAAAGRARARRSSRPARRRRR